MRLEPTTPTPPRSEVGSILLIALVLVATLTLLAVSLRLVTQAERITAARELGIDRALLAAESGLRTLTFQTLSGHPGPIEIEVGGPSELQESTHLASQLVDRITTSELLPLQSQTCSLCQINGDLALSSVWHAAASRALRVLPSDPDAEPVARRTISAWVVVEPWLPSAPSFEQTTLEPTESLVPRF